MKRYFISILGSIFIVLCIWALYAGFLHLLIAYAAPNPYHPANPTNYSGVSDIPPPVMVGTMGGASIFTTPSQNGLAYTIDWEKILKAQGFQKGHTLEFHCDGNAASDACGNESGTTTGWTSVNLGSGNSFYASTTIKSTGNSSLAANANVNPALSERFFKDIGADWSLVTGGLYKLTFDARHHGVGATWQIILNNFNNMTSPTLTIGSLTSADTTFSSYSINFIYDSNYQYLVFGEISANTGGVYVDNISITEESPRAARGLGTPTYSNSGATRYVYNPLTDLLEISYANQIPITGHAGKYWLDAQSAVTYELTNNIDLTDVAWTKSQSGVSYQGTAPDGTETAYHLWENGMAGIAHSMRQTVDDTVFTLGDPITLWAYVQPNTRDEVRLSYQDTASTWHTAFFDLGDNTIGTLSGISKAGISEETYNGYKRLWIIGHIGTGGANDPNFYVHLVIPPEDITYDGDGDSGVSIWRPGASRTAWLPAHVDTDASAVKYTSSSGQPNWPVPQGIFAETLGGELYTTGNAASDPNGNEANGTAGWNSISVLTSDAADPSVGTWNLKSVGDQFEVLWFQVTTLTLNNEFKLTFDHKGGVGEQIRVQISNISASNASMEVYITGTGGWESYKFYFEQLYSNNDHKYIHFTHWSAGNTTANFDNISLKPVLSARTSTPSDGLWPPHGTVMFDWMPLFDYDVPLFGGTAGLLSMRNHALSTLNILRSGGNGFVRTTDGTTSLSKSLNWSAWDIIKVAIRFGFLEDNVSKMRIGLDSGNGISWVSTVNYDGAYTLDTTLNYFYDGFGRSFFGNLLIYNRILTDNEINWTGGSP